jgi:hypothetical protein
MSANIGRIVAEITANTAGLRRGAADAQRIMQDTSNGASAAGKAINIAFAVTAALGVMKLIDKLEDCTQVAIDNKKALMGLESVAKAYGVSADEAKKATQSFTQDGLLQMKSATIGMKNIISTGFNITEAMKLSEALKDIGAFNNVTGDLGQAFEDVTKGMRTGSIELIENIGLTQKLSAVMKAANVDISNGIDLTNNAAQREAFYNMALKEGEKFKGNAAKLAGDQASSQAKANAAMQEAADAIGNRLLPAYSSLMGIITDVSKKTADIFKKSEFEKVTKEMEKQQIMLYGLGSSFLDLKSKTKLTAEEQETYNDIIKQLQQMFPDVLKNIDLQNLKYADAVKLLQQLNAEMENKILIQQSEATVKDYSEKIVKSLKKEAEATQRLITARGYLKKAQEGNNGLKIGEWAQEVRNQEKRIEDEKKTREYYRQQIENTKNYYKDLIKLNESAKKSFFVQPEGIYNNYDKSKKPDIITTKEDSGKKERFSLDTTESTKQKLIEQEYKYKVDLANAKEEEKWRVDLENRKAVAIINATAENEKKIAAIREKVESGKLSESEGKKQAQALNEALAEQIGKLELDLKIKEKGVDYAKNALGLSSLENYGIIVPIAGDATQLENELQRIADNKMREINKQGGAVGLMDMSNYGVTARTREDDIADENRVKSEYVNKSLEDVTKSFADLASVLDNDVLNALSNVANQAMNMKGSISGFNAAQGAGDKLGMLSSGLGMFSSAVSIFQIVGGLFSKSTYNFDEAVKKMLAGIGEKTPNLQVAEYQKAMSIYNYLNEIGKSNGNQVFSETESNKLKELGANMQGGQMQGGYMGFLSSATNELLANLKEIIPQLAEQLGTAAGDFGSSIGSALSSATTSEELKANLYDSIYGTVKSGLINAFLAGELMKPLLENLQQTVTLAVADGTLDAAEKTAIQGLLGNVNTEADKFYTALEEVGLNVVDAAGQLNEAADRMDNVNRNLRLADRISTITTQTSTAGITQLAGNSSIIYDFSNANLGGMTEQQVISAVSKANRMASVRKVGV